MTQDAVEGFYQKNIDWQRKVQKETKLKQYEKINEGISGLTFTPKIVILFLCRTHGEISLAKKTYLFSSKKELKNSCSVSSEPKTVYRLFKVERKIPIPKSGTSRNANSLTSIEIVYKCLANICHVRMST